MPQTAHWVIRRNDCPPCESGQVVPQKTKETYWGIGSMNYPIRASGNREHFLPNEDAARSLICSMALSLKPTAQPSSQKMPGTSPEHLRGVEINVESY